MPTIGRAGIAMKILILAFVLSLPAAAFADTQGKVHPEPTANCEGFKPHHLCFEVPKDGIARAEYSSEPFYAIILRTAGRCGIAEQERLEVQELFSRSKVFFESFNCNDDLEDFIRYTNVNDKFSFLAVHAGASMKEAKKLLSEVKATGKFPGANIRKMQASIVFP
jgi:hypothetical protein